MRREAELHTTLSCRDIDLLMQQTAGVSRGRNGFRKDKGGGETRRERGRPSPAPHRRHRRFRHPLYRMFKIPSKLQFPLELYGRGITHSNGTNQPYSRSEIAQQLKVSEATIKRAIQKLIDKKLVQRKGSNKTGPLEIIDNNQ